MEKIRPNHRRLSRQEYFMKIAEVAAERGTCPKAQVGAILVDPETNRVVSMGFNGSAKNTPHCNDVGCLEIELNTGHGQKSCIRTIHAELNAILHLERRYERLHLYTTHQPCFQCFKALVATGIDTIYYISPYLDVAREMIHNEMPWILMTQVGPL